MREGRPRATAKSWELGGGGEGGEFFQGVEVAGGAVGGGGDDEFGLALAFGVVDVDFAEAGGWTFSMVRLRRVEWRSAGGAWSRKKMRVWLGAALGKGLGGDDGVEFGGGAEEDGGGVFGVGLEGEGLEFEFDLRFGFVGGEEDVAALAMQVRTLARPADWQSLMRSVMGSLPVPPTLMARSRAM